MALPSRRDKNTINPTPALPTLAKDMSPREEQQILH